MAGPVSLYQATSASVHTLDGRILLALHGERVRVDLVFADPDNADRLAGLLYALRQSVSPLTIDAPEGGEIESEDDGFAPGPKEVEED
jgi:hypothetical protein